MAHRLEGRPLRLNGTALYCVCCIGVGVYIWPGHISSQEVVACKIFIPCIEYHSHGWPHEAEQGFARPLLCVVQSTFSSLQVPSSALT